MDEKLEGLFDRLEKLVTRWLEEFEAHPLRAGLRVLVVLYCIKFARGVLR